MAGKFDISVTDYEVYVDGVEFIGVAQVTLPTITWLSQTINGSGISGNIDAIIPGLVDAMTMTMNFKLINENAMKLTRPEVHHIELRADQVKEDPITGNIVHVLEKHVTKAVPKSLNLGTLQPASPTDANGEYAVRYIKTSLNGKVAIELDPANGIIIVDGKDYGNKQYLA